MQRFTPDMVFDLLAQWWPALGLTLVVFFALKFILSKSSRPNRKLDSLSLAIHEIQTSLACTEQQAKQLLAIYGGSSAKAIQEIKTGRAVLPGAEVSDLALFGGEVKGLGLSGDDLIVHTQDGRSEVIDSSNEGLLLLGVVDPAQRPDPRGLGRCDRGHTYGQLFCLQNGDWVRFLLNASRFDYVYLAERKQNSAVRNFQVVLEDLLKHKYTLGTGEDFKAFLNDLRAPLYKQLADFEAYAVQTLRNTKGA